MSEGTGFLFADPSFLGGVGRIFDVGNAMAEYNVSRSGQIADALAFRADAHALAQDAAMVMDSYVQDLLDALDKIESDLSVGTESATS